jgi:hypothetical protein
MKERLQKEEARRLIESQKNKLVSSMQRLAEASGMLGAEGMMGLVGDEEGAQAGSSEPLKDLFVGKKHPMTPYMSDNETKFFIVRAPCEDFLLLAARRSSWCLTPNAL